jgi:uncharacterized membrane protein YkoI
MKRITPLITTTIVSAVVIVGAGAAYVAAGDDGASVAGDDVQRATDAALAETGGGTVTEVEHDDGGYDVEVRLADGTEVDVELTGDFTVRSNETDTPDGQGDDADEAVLADSERQQATDAALAEVGGGSVTDVEHDGTGFDVEVRLDDGTEVDVDLAADFSVLHTENDD